MHDAVDFEGRGIPTAAVVTTEFVTAAAAQAQSLGLPGYNVVVVPHPIQILTRDEVRERANQAFDGVIGRLIASDAGCR